MADKKKQHIIPNGYLKAWKDNNIPYNTPHIWVFNKAKDTCVHLPTTNNIFTKDNFYTLYDESENKDFAIEDTFAVHENNFYLLRDEKLLNTQKIHEDEHHKICILLAPLKQVV